MAVIAALTAAGLLICCATLAIGLSDYFESTAGLENRDKLKQTGLMIGGAAVMLLVMGLASPIRFGNKLCRFAAIVLIVNAVMCPFWGPNRTVAGAVRQRPDSGPVPGHPGWEEAAESRPDRAVSFTE